MRALDGSESLRFLLYLAPHPTVCLCGAPERPGTDLRGASKRCRGPVQTRELDGEGDPRAPSRPHRRSDAMLGHVREHEHCPTEERAAPCLAALEH